MKTDLTKRLDAITAQLPSPLSDESLLGLMTRRYAYLRSQGGCEVAANSVNSDMRWSLLMSGEAGREALTVPVSILAAHGAGALLCGAALWDRLTAEIETSPISPAEARDLAGQLNYLDLSDWLDHCLQKHDCREFFSCGGACTWPRENGW